jgi:serine protease
VKIAILDTGVNAELPDLAGRVFPGYNFVDRSTDTRDLDGHGSVVAGIAAANTSNRVGMAGVAWRASILPVKVLDDSGSGTDAEIASGITWAADNGASVINRSLGDAEQSDVL